MTSARIRSVRLPSGEAVPALGLGTWGLAEHPGRAKDEIRTLQIGIDLGMTLIDTAEMYADGATETLVGKAIAGRREEVFLVSKVLPENATRRGTVAACERSLKRLGTDSLDLYLLHWRESVPLEETIAGFEALMGAGKIRRWGVSNFDTGDMEELIALPGGDAVQTDQVLYNLSSRGIEYDLMPWCASRDIPIMAYSPIAQGRLLDERPLLEVATRNGATPTQIALAWVLRNESVIAIPKTAAPEHVRENRAALDVELTDEDLAELDRAFPPPRSRRPLDIL